jgi:hypothetical protein
MRSIENGQVCCRSQGSQAHCRQTMPLPTREGLRRFLPHVFPESVHQVRDDGLGSPVHRSLRHPLQRWLARPEAASPPASSNLARQTTDSWGPRIRAGQCCPCAAPFPDPTGGHQDGLRCRLECPLHERRHPSRRLFQPTGASVSSERSCGQRGRPAALAAVPPHTRACLPLLTTKDHAPSSNASAKMLPPWVRLE